jgi:hypothetical protein
MKIVIPLLAPLTALFTAAHTNAQPFTLTGQVVAGGGGLASDGQFQIIGTIAQPEAGPQLTGGCFSIDSGFWGAYAAVLTPGAPLLRIRQSDPNYIRVAFAPGCNDWVLQWTRTLETASTPTVWTDDGARNLILVGDELTRDFHIPSWGSRLFFRLRKL